MSNALFTRAVVRFIHIGSIPIQSPNDALDLWAAMQDAHRANLSNDEEPANLARRNKLSTMEELLKQSSTPDSKATILFTALRACVDAMPRKDATSLAQAAEPHRVDGVKALFVLLAPVEIRKAARNNIRWMEDLADERICKCVGLLSHRENCPEYVETM